MQPNHGLELEVMTFWPGNLPSDAYLLTYLAAWKCMRQEGIRHKRERENENEKCCIKNCDGCKFVISGVSG